MRKRKRVALFANGWAKECLEEVGQGIRKCAMESDVDVFAFVNYSLPMTEDENSGEFSIFQFVDMKDYDGALFLTNSFNMQRELDVLHSRWQESGIPALSMEGKLDGMGFLGSDNFAGMYELAVHMFRDHKVEKVLFMGGTPDHPDSQTRLKAVVKAAMENGVEIPQDNVRFGNWAEGPASEQLADWMEKNGGLPDAIICANDIMAIGICDYLKGKGYKIPEDVKITGFDYIPRGQEYSPKLTSVGRSGSEMGYRAMRLLLEKIAGRGIPSHTMLKSRVMYGESCGCDESVRKGAKDQESESAVAKFEHMKTDQHFRILYMALRRIENQDDFHRSFSYFAEHNHWMEGDNFMLCLHPRFFDMDESELFYENPDPMEDINVVCALHDGCAEECMKLPVKEAMFRAANRSEKAGTYIFVPVCGEDKNMGFAMLSRDFGIVNDFMLYMWTRHVNQYVEQMRSNVKIADLTKRLRELSVTDVLTGLYNRMGCERILYPFVETCQEKGGRGIVMLADIDRMKIINDKYGHSQGDLALQTVAAVLKAELPKGYMAARFGGDEFFIVGESDDPVSIEEIAKQVSGQLDKEIKRRKIEFPLSISIGGVQLEKGDEFRLNDCLQKADEMMYRVKERHHKRLENM